MSYRPIYRIVPNFERLTVAELWERNCNYRPQTQSAPAIDAGAPYARLLEDQPLP